jgi:hypothetical protein
MHLHSPSVMPHEWYQGCVMQQTLAFDEESRRCAPQRRQRATMVAVRDEDGRWVEQHLLDGDVLDVYALWPAPAMIVSDGAYGVGGFPGDPRTPDGLLNWYRDHIEAWSKAAHPATTLWFWNTEIGWATVHPLLVAHGWDYVQTIVWDKGIAHIAGNVNGETIRRFPVVTEVCVFYRRQLSFPTLDGKTLIAKQWLRHECFT